MAKILKNTTLAPISIQDTGVTIPVAPSNYEIPVQDYTLWAVSLNTLPLISNGTLVLNDGISDLSPSDALAYLGYSNFADSIRFRSEPEVSNGLTSKTVQTVVESINTRVVALEAGSVTVNYDKILFDDTSEILNDDEFNLLIED